MKTLKPKTIQRYLLWAACAIFTHPLFAGELKDIQFSSLQGGRFEARMTFDSAPPEPKGYTIEKPARIALDLPGVSSGLPQKKYPLSYGNASSAIVLEGNGRTRVVLNLLELVPYATRIEGNDLVVEVGSVATEYLKESGGALEQVASSTPSVETASGNQITDMDFKRGADGEGMLILSLKDPKADINVYEQGTKIFVEFSEMSLPENLRRRYDVGDFATPVQVIDAKSTSRGARFELKSSGDYDYLAYQADNEYVLSVKPLTQEEVEERRKEFAFVGEKLSLNFQDIEVRAVLQLIADFTELNLVASDTVSGNITLRLKNVPWDQALELVLKTKGLDKRLVGNVLMVAPAAEIAERERQEIEAQKQVRELAPLRSEFIRIRYADAADLMTLFERTSTGGGGNSDEGEDILSERGRVVLESRTNSLLITETADKLDEIRRLIKQIDVPIRQVQIEARIVRASTDFDKSLGVRWGGAFYDVNDAGNILSANGTIEENNETTSNLISAAAAGNNSFEVVPGMIADLGVAGAAGSFALGFIEDDHFLNLELSALESKGRGEIVSQPKVITGDKEPAIIKAGTEIPYPQSSANGETTIAFKEAVLSLDVTPIITPDDRILLDLLINQDTVGQLVISTGLGGQVPTIDTTELKTKVLVGNGETVVLGGVYETTDIESVTKVPFFGDLPYIGRLFRRTSVDQDKSELLIFITPRILADTLVE
ncbi:type IV pilus assembly protein PilQ [Litorivivens lipolytica]|uniref:Type IV pilus assembly protein PilQ n=1 Tax=Litorivivens lipolytica TaxID=1524264 RepID=A0A7W4W5L5_9GAMM|nr:type IV pilus secretin PilQ [Litorivivens lipolytica]MBB3047775.1 type IV pilus assembly protein PilQ [Litorivivens lipolytica]